MEKLIRNKELLEPVCGVYKIINLITGDYYIGSSNNIRKRQVNHLSRLKKGTHNTKKLQKIHDEIGRENLKFVLIEESTLEELRIKEQYYLDLYKPIYNNDDLLVNHKNSEEHISKLVERSSRKVYQYDLNGNFIKEWSSGVEANKFLNLSSRAISSAIAKNHNCGGFIWLYEKFDKLDIISLGASWKPIVQIENNVVINKWKSIQSCAQYFKVPPDRITTALKNNRFFQGNILLQYETSILQRT